MVVGLSYIKMILREFKKSFGRFAAIFGIVALGVGILSGLFITTPDMHDSVDQYYDDHNTADIFIKGTMGLTQDDLDKLNKEANVKEIMPAYVLDKIIDLNGKESLTAKIYGIPLINSKDEVHVNELELIKGRMPENNKECLVERSGPFLKNIKIGEKIKISDENEDYEDIDDIYAVKEYEVVGIVGNSFHFGKERETSNIGSGKLDSVIYVDKSSYSLEEYTDFYIVLNNAKDMNAFSSEYEDFSKENTEHIETIGKDRSKKRKIQILDEANEKLNEGKDEHKEEKEKAEKELADALDEINEGKEELRSAAIEIKDAEIELEKARTKLRDENKKALKKIKDAEIELEDAKSELSKAEKKLNDAKIKLEDGQKEYDDGYKEYLDGKKELEDAQKKLIEGNTEFEKSKQKFLDGEQKLKDAKLELEKAKKELDKGQSQYNDGIDEFKARKREFLYGIEPLARELGYRYPEDLVSTKRGQSDLRSYVNNARRQLEDSLAEAIAERNQLEEAIQKLKNDEKQKQDLEAQLTELNRTISDLKDKLSEIPDANFLIDSWYEIEDGELELEKTKKDLDKGFKEYNEGLAKIIESEKELKDVEKKLEEGKKEIQENEDKLSAAIVDLGKAEKELKDAKDELEKGKTDYKSGLIEYQEGEKKYQDGVIELQDAKKTLEKETAKATKKILDGEKELKDGKKDYQEGLDDIKQAEIDYQKGKEEADEELAKAYDEILDAEKEIRDLEDPEWYVLDRNSNISFVSFKLNSDKVNAISKVFPIFFYLVAGLVALTTMTRMVEEERTQIGVLKALGYSKSIIIAKYILYCGLASLLGSIVGQIVGFEVIPRVIWNAYGVIYHLPEFVIDYNKRIAFLSSGVAILSTVVATYFAASNSLKEKPSLLMLPKPPKKGKRILLERIRPLWSALSFNLKSTARNLFRYKKHFFMTVIGVSGCTALLVTGFGLRNSFQDLGTYQFDEIFKYQLNVQLEEDYSPENLNSISADNKDIKDMTEVYIDEGHLLLGDKSEEINLVGVDDLGNFSDYILFRNRKSGKHIDFDPNKIIITEKISEELNIKVGDTIEYKNSDDIKNNFKVDAITENYIGNFLYMDKAQYEDALGEKKANNTIYAKTENLKASEEDNLIEKLYENEDVLSTEFISQRRGIFDNLVESINYIVIVIIVASGLLAFIVLYNLTNININERRRELATLKVLGFHNSEVASYIFREITILAIIGTLVGLVLGKLLHQFIIINVEDPDFMFGRNIKAMSYVLSAIITMIFSGIVDLFMLKKVKDIKMVDSMKAND